MVKIVFENGVETLAQFRNVKDGVVELIGGSVGNISGFKAYTPKGRLLGDYSEYKTVYNVYTEIEGGIQLSTGELEPVPPPVPEPKTEAKVTFVGVDCTLDGTLEVTVPVGTDASTLEVPTAKTDFKHKLTEWNPPIEGEISDDVTYTMVAELKDDFTVEGRIKTLEESVMEMADVVYS